MPPAEGNFNPELEILWDGKGAAARGPLRWSRDGKTMSLHVVIMQDGGSATGRTGDDLTHGASEFLIAAAVQNGTLEEGPAIATGLALFRGSEPEMYQWSTPVTLKRSGAAPHFEHDLAPHKKARTHA